MLVQKEDVYSNFINSIKSEVTKKIYEYNLRLFMEFCGIDRYEDLIGLQNQIIPYLMSAREKKLSYNFIHFRFYYFSNFGVRSFHKNPINLRKKGFRSLRYRYFPINLLVQLVQLVQIYPEGHQRLRFRHLDFGQSPSKFCHQN